MDDDIEKTLVQILVEKFHLESMSLGSETSLANLGLDSLALMEFVFAIEDAFKIRIPEDRIDPQQEAITLGVLVEIIREHLNT